MAHYQIKRLYRNHASVRSNVIESCIKANEPLTLTYKDKKMTLSVEDLKDYKQVFTKNVFRSKFDGSLYKLFDYRFIDDKELQVRQLQLL